MTAGLRPASAPIAALGLVLALTGLAAAEVTIDPNDRACAAGGCLEDAIRRAEVGSTIHLLPGEHVLRPRPYLETTCGNCEDPATEVNATVGLLVGGRGVKIAGVRSRTDLRPAPPGSVRIVTGSGYGILFEGCHDCAIEDVTITGGVRDPDPNATDAAVVVKRSSVRIERCVITGNVGDPEVVGPIVVGIIGIAGREDSEVHVEKCRILGQSWDGIALYRGARAAIFDNVIDGVDGARGRTIAGGRGVGIGVTWNARAVILGNLVRRYWKGIGLFVDAEGIVRENVVEDVLTWGISLWDAGKGTPRGVIERNVVFGTGACGVSITSRTEGDPGRAVGNVLAETGQDPQYDSGEPYCVQTALARHTVPGTFAIDANLAFANREPNDAPGAADLSEPVFEAGIAPLVRRLRAWRSLWGSRFLVRFGS